MRPTLVKFAGKVGQTAGRTAYGGFKPPHVSQTYVNLSVFAQSVMWFWVLYRAKEDGAVLLVRSIVSLV